MPCRKDINFIDKPKRKQSHSWRNIKTVEETFKSIDQRIKKTGI